MGSPAPAPAPAPAPPGPGSTPAVSVSPSRHIFVQSLLAGGVAGTTVDLSLYPIDTVKTRIQSSRGFAASGGFGGIYAGVGSALIGSAPGAALFFVTYEASKSFLQRQRLVSHLSPSDGHVQASRPPSLNQKPSTDRFRESVEHMLAASLGEIAACAVRVPTEVVKQRAQASQHPSSLAALRSILALRSKGFSRMWRELYRGWSVTILREVPFTVIQFPLWEALKKWRCMYTGDSSSTASESALFGCISGAVAAAFTTPLDVVKTRMMLASEGHPVLALTRTILHKEGPRAFLAGLGPRVSWISAGGAIFLGTYQLATNTVNDFL